MIKITGIKIANFRSFKDKENTATSLSFINVFVGKNNVGKTNFLRAVYLFFNPQNYKPATDINYIKQLTGGGTKNPKISLDFEDDNLDKTSTVSYTLICDFNNKEKILQY